MLNFPLRFFCTILLCCISSLSYISSSYAQVLNIDPSTVDAKSWIIFDPQSKQIIAESESNQLRAPASLTKMMVGYLALKAVETQQLNLDQVITVPEIVNTVQSDESRLKLKIGEQITVKELIEGLIIMSANDAALILGTLISGDTQTFLKLMNDTAQKLGMVNTHFSNPSGITMQNHFSTAHDLALLSQAIVNETPEYLQYSKQPEFRYKDIYHHATNILLKKDPSVDGLKTGYTEAAGYNLSLTANRLDQNTNEYRRLIVIVMGTTSKQKRADVAENLINIAFNYTQTKRLFDHDQVIADIPVLNSTKRIYQVKLTQSKSYHTLSLLNQQNHNLNAKEFDLSKQRFIVSEHAIEPLSKPEKISYSVSLLEKNLIAPIHHQTLPLVTIDVKQFDKSIHQFEIVENIELNEANFWQKIGLWFSSLLESIQGHNQQTVIYPIQLQ